MHHTAESSATTRRSLGRAPFGLVIVIAAIIGTLVSQSGSSSASSFSEADVPGAHGGMPLATSPMSPPSEERDRGDHRGATAVADGAVTKADGALPAGVTVFDHTYPGIAHLDADLLGALREAATDAADDGIEFVINSGWRSPDYQDQLLREAIAKYGSEKEAARWVATVDTSAHVSGDAVDIGSVAATAWLSEHGAHYGLCQIYRNEAWHYELRPKAQAGGCPPMYADSAHDPGTQR